MSPIRRTGRDAAGRPRTAMPLTSDTLPHLSAFLSGYLHQDLAITYRTPARALQAFLAEASAVDRRALADDWRRFRAATEGWAWRDVRRAFGALGGAWTPPRRSALEALFSAVW